MPAYVPTPGGRQDRGSSARAGRRRARHLFGRVVDHDVDARDGVVLAAERLEVRRREGRALAQAQVRRTPLCLGRHRARDVRGDDGRAALGEWNGERADAAAGVAPGAVGQGLPPVRVDPFQDLVHRLPVASPDIQLRRSGKGGQPW